ncbi:MAG TPA: hypothetical protein VMZ53_02535 [Kofleriaceae bacterium]|nr:hypothetical protein [Kofleriaceae bacterium]
MMIVGIAALVRNALDGRDFERLLSPPSGRHWHAWQIIVGTWIAATAAGLLGMLVRDRGDRWRVVSYVVPAAAVALILPLTIHMPIVLYMGGTDAFDGWVQYAGLFVLLAHITFAAMVGARAKAIVEGREPTPVHSIYGITVAMACVPGLIVIIPVIVTAATGVPILPLLYLMERWGARARLEGEMPMAVARIAS